jgi:hypothetical protein
MVEECRLSFSTTQTQIKALAQSDTVWMLSALSLRNAAKALREKVDEAYKLTIFAKLTGNEDSATAPDLSKVAPMLMLYGMMFECLLKTRHIALNPAFDPTAEKGKWWTGHNLKDLATKTNWSLSRYTRDDLIVIDELSTAIQLGRYPFHTRDARSGSVWGFKEAERVDRVLNSAFQEIWSLVLTKLETEGLASDLVARSELLSHEFEGTHAK